MSLSGNDVRACLPAAQQDVEHDRDDDDVADRVREADDLRERAVAPGLVHRAEDDRPARRAAASRRSSGRRGRCAPGRRSTARRTAARSARPPRAGLRSGSRRRRTTGTAPRARAPTRTTSRASARSPRRGTPRPSSAQVRRYGPLRQAAWKQPSAAATGATTEADVRDRLADRRVDGQQQDRPDGRDNGSAGAKRQEPPPGRRRERHLLSYRPSRAAALHPSE